MKKIALSMLVFFAATGNASAAVNLLCNHDGITVNAYDIYPNTNTTGQHYVMLEVIYKGFSSGDEFKCKDGTAESVKFDRTGAGGDNHGYVGTVELSFTAPTKVTLDGILYGSGWNNLQLKNTVIDCQVTESN